jgi:hypothetical protein
MQERIEIGYQAFVSDGGEEFGAIFATSLRKVSWCTSRTRVISASPLDAVKAVHSHKVVFDCGKARTTDSAAQSAHAHDAEVPGF